MFWGLIMEPNKRYTQTVEKSFHVSMACLDLSTVDNEPVQVMLCFDGRNYLICSLSKDSQWQVPLDLNFQEGTKIAFTCNGQGHVHLTGYLVPEDDLDIDELEEEAEDEEEDEEAEEEDDEQIPQLVKKQPKRKALSSPNDTKKDNKRIKQDPKTEADETKELDGSKDDDSEDSDDDDDDALNELDDSEEDDIEEEEEEEEEEVEEEEETEVKQTKKKPLKTQQGKKNEQIQQQQKKKEKLVNGKEVKQEVQNKQQKKNKGEQQQQQQQQQQQKQQQQNEQKKRTVEGGIQIEELKVGGGATAKPGKFVSVYYVGRLKNGKKFDATTQGDGFKFRLGKGEVIKGWDIGVAGMKVGGKRRITIPPALAYGAKGSPPVIPGNSTLIFEVELRNVH